MGCLFSCFYKQSQAELTTQLVNKGDTRYYESISDRGEPDMSDFSAKNAKQITVVDSLGVASSKVSVDDFAFLKVNQGVQLQSLIEYRYLVKDLLVKW